MFRPSTKRLVPVEDAVAVGILVDRDLVLAAEVVGRRRRDLVVDGAPDSVVADHLQAGRIRDIAGTEPPRAARVRRSEIETGWRTIGSARTSSS